MCRDALELSLTGVLWGLHANPFLIAAIIGLSVVYKAFDNMDGFRRALGVQPNTRAAVLVFGLFHGWRSGRCSR